MFAKDISLKMVLSLDGDRTEKWVIPVCPELLQKRTCNVKRYLYLKSEIEMDSARTKKGNTSHALFVRVPRHSISPSIHCGTRLRNHRNKLCRSPKSSKERLQKNDRQRCK